MQQRQQTNLEPPLSRLSLAQADAADQWSHLIPLDLAPSEKHKVKIKRRLANAIRLAARSLQNHKSNLGYYYRYQRAQYDSGKAIKNTAHKLCRVLYRMATTRQVLEETTVFAKLKDGNQKRRLSKLQSNIRPTGYLDRSLLLDNSRGKIKTGAQWVDSISIEDATISVAIPTKNAGNDFRPLLSMLKNQKGFKKIDVVVVDSGSTDQTLQVAREFKTEIIEIPSQAFSHSYSRNLAAERATGDYLLFMVQDALPPSVTWLHNLFLPIKSDGVIASSCAEFPREDADLFYRALSWNHYWFMDIQDQDRILERPRRTDYLSLRQNANVSNVACLINRKVFLKYRFRGDYAEDLDLGLRLIMDGHKMALLGSTRVIHSHNRSAYHHLKRAYVDNIFLAGLFSDYPVRGVPAERLLGDIIFVYEVVNSIVRETLKLDSQLCPLEVIKKTVMGELNNSAKRLRPVQLTVKEGGYIDPEFQSFIANVHKSYHATGVIGHRYDGILLDALKGFIGMMLQYMGEVYDNIDEPLMNDFRKCLFKAFALTCGVHLSSSLCSGSPETQKILQDICGTLQDTQ